MFYNVKKLHQILKISKLDNFLFLSFMILINSFIELISIGMLIPIAGVIVDEKIYFEFQNVISNSNFPFKNMFIESSKKQFMQILILFTGLIYLIKFLINLIFSWYTLSIRTKYEQIISNQVLKNISETLNLDFLNISSSRFISIMMFKIGNTTSSLINIINFFVEIIVFSVILLFIFLNYPKEAIIIFIILSLVTFLFFIFYRKKVVRWSDERGKAGDSKQKNLTDFFQGIRELLVYSKFENFSKVFSESNKKWLFPQKKILFTNSLPKINLELLFIFSFLIIIFYFVYNELDYNSIIITLSILLVLSLRLLPSVNKIIFNFNQFKYASESIQEVFSLLKITSDQPNVSKEIIFKDTINLEKLHFHYEHDKSILENINLKIKFNSKIGIVGDSGSGKSTLIDIIIGLLKPSKGKILMDNSNYEILNKKKLFNNFSYVSQKVFIFDTSIRQNICLKNDNEEIDELNFSNAIKISELEDFISSKKEKKFFNLGEFGKNISGGQRQKIGIARAIYANRPIIIFDESTNALDEQNEKKIISNIMKLNHKTIIFISHNHNNLLNFDEIFKIDNKTISKFSL